MGEKDTGLRDLLRLLRGGSDWDGALGFFGG